MKVKNATIAQVNDALTAVSDLLYDGNLIFKREPETTGIKVLWTHFTLTVANSRRSGSRKSNTGRRISAACWHAHRDVMQALFAVAPGAVLLTATARYETRDGFLSVFPDTGNKNIGSVASPMCYADACDCEKQEMSAHYLYWDTVAARTAVDGNIAKHIKELSH